MGLVKEIYIDIDTDYTSYIEDGKVAEFIQQLLKGFCFHFELWIRRSASDRVHHKIVLEEPVSLFESLQIRAMLGDDAFRIRQDLARYYYTQEITKTGRIFDEKFINGEVKRAGKWIRLF